MVKTPSTPPANEPVDIQPDNLRFWNVLGRTDPRHTKAFTRGGGFKGTAMKPMWQNKILTEMFGPCGTGWGIDTPNYQIVDGAKDEKLVYCIVRCWYVDPASPAPKPEEWSDSNRQYLTGVGGDKVVAKFSSGLSNDDEAFKKAFTDAIGNAFKFVGVGADVHMGLFDDSKYVQDLQAEFEANDDTLGKELDALLDQVRTCADLKALTTELLPVVKTMLDKLKEAKRQGEGSMLTSTYNARKAKLSPPKDDDIGDPGAVADRDATNDATGN